MMIYPYPNYPRDHINGNGFNEYERDKYFFISTIEALQHWNHHLENGMRERPVVPEAYEPNLATKAVKDYFDNHYNAQKPLECEHFDEAAGLLGKMVQTNGVEGMYSFFNVLSSVDTGRSNELDKIRFKKVLTDVIVPHFEPAPTEEILHGVATAGHVLLAPLAGLIGFAHTPVAAYSAMRFRQLRNKRLERREEPPLEVIDHMMPLLRSMHVIAQRSVDVLNDIQPIEDRVFPSVAPLDTKILEAALERVRHGDDLLDQPEYMAR